MLTVRTTDRTARTAMLLAGLAASAVAIDRAWSDGRAAAVVLVVFAIAPDLTMLIGANRVTEPGALSRRAVPFYNLTHRVWLPIVIVGLSAMASVTIGLVAGCAWFAHIAFDRAAGYGLRATDGRRRSSARPVPSVST